MTIIFKCGQCGHQYTVDTQRVANSSHSCQCPNCSADMPKSVIDFAKAIATMKNHPNADGWQIFNLPDEFSTATVSVTLHGE